MSFLKNAAFSSALNDILSTEFENTVYEILNSADVDYLPVKKILQLLNKEYRKKGTVFEATPSELRVSLNKRMDVNLVVKAGYVSGKRVEYIVKQIPAGELIMNLVSKRPGITVKQLAGSLPLTKKEYLPELNQLLVKGALIPEITTHDTLRLHKSYQKDAETITGAEAFKKAYDVAGEGKSFVRIHKIREFLNWDNDAFDRMIRTLCADFSIELHGGDPSLFTKKEIENAYTDENGIRFLTLSWRGGHDTR